MVKYVYDTGDKHRHPDWMLTANKWIKYDPESIVKEVVTP